MAKLKEKIILTVLSMSFISSLVTSSRAFAQVQIQVNEEAKARTLTENADSQIVTTLDPGKPTSIDLSHPTEITENNRVPMILVGLHSSASLVTLDPPLLKNSMAKIRDEQMDEILSGLMSKLADIQYLIETKATPQAMESLERLESQHPNLKFLEFTRASILLLQGKREEAIRVAQMALKALPDYEEGKVFVEKLTGQKQKSGDHP